MPFHKETHQRINQVNSAVGWPAVLDWSDIDDMTATMTATSFGRLSELDGNPLAQRHASDIMEAVLRPKEGEQIDTDTAWCPGYEKLDEFDPRIIAFIYRTDGTYVRVTLTSADQWREVAGAYLNSESRCEAHNQPACAYFEDSSSWIDLQPYAVKRGEHIVILHMCAGCRDYLNFWNGIPENIQTEPQGWIDEGPKFDTDSDDPWA